MKPNRHPYLSKPVWNTKYSIIAIFFCISLFIFFELYFGRLMKSFIWLFAGILVVIFFLIGLNYTIRNWRSLPTKQFLRILFTYSLVLRLLTMLLLYFIFKHLTGTPFSIGEGFDEYSYHIFGTDIANGWKHGDFQIFKYIPFGFGYSGYPAFCGALYFLFGSSTIIARIANCIIGSFSVLLTYKIARELWGKDVGRTAGIIAMLFPLMVFYSSIQLKDTALSFLVLFVTYNIFKLGSYKKMKFWQIVLIIGAVYSLFTFRIVVAVITIICILIYSIYPRVKLERQKISWMLKITAGIFIILGTLFLLNKVGEDKASINKIVAIYGMAEYRVDQWAMSSSGISKYASLGSFVFLVFPAPFPTLVNIPLDTTSAPIRGEYYHIGIILVWNIVSFFALIGMLSTIKNQFRFIPLWLFTLFYLFILAQSNFIMGIRFRMVIASFLIIFTAVGLHKKIRNKIEWWILYLLGNVFLIFGWNYFRLAGRGLI